MPSADLRRYLAGTALSEVGSSAMALVAGVWVKSLTGSNSAAGLVSACLYLPSLFAPAAGLVADRVDRRRLLVLVNLLAAGWLLPLLLVDSAGLAWVVYVIMIGYGTVLVVLGPAETALFTEVVPAGERGGVNGLRLSIQEGSKLVAPLAGAWLFTVAGGPAVAVADAVTFGAAAWVVSRLRTGRRPADPSVHPSADPSGDPAVDARSTRPAWRGELLAGWRHLRGTPALWRLTAVGGGAMAASGITVAAQYDLLDELHRPPSYLGVLVSVLGAGSIVAGLSTGRMLRLVDERGLALIALADGVAGYLLIATGQLPAVLAGRFLLGLFLPWILVAAVTAGQRLTPDRLQGRVASVIFFLLFAPVPVSQAVGAVALSRVGYRPAYLLAAGCAAMLLGVLSLRSDADPPAGR